ncbi:MAG: DUF3991 and TOPRIM domain-containing protein [Lachnospiraceae bacterium]|nr:DUF3991 and TOPRIM domain-containing protein [Lachnospiraceae bacterium]
MSKDRLEIAKSVPLTELVVHAGYTPLKRGSKYILREHDSFVIFPNTNSYCHYSRLGSGEHCTGTTIDFCEGYMNMETKEAIDYLLELAGYDKNYGKQEWKEMQIAKETGQRVKGGTNAATKRRDETDGMPDQVRVLPQCEHLSYGDDFAAFYAEDEEEKKLVLPQANADNKRVIAYLTKTRGIDIAVLNSFLRRGRLYESADYHNCVFVTYDENKVPRYASQRSTVPASKFKADVTGSDKSYGFPLHNAGSNKVTVFEAPIDMLSYMSLYPEDKSSKVALGCLSPRALYRFLREYEHIDEVSIMLDDDAPAIKAGERLKEVLTNHGYKVEDNPLRELLKDYEAKDVNEYLQMVNESQPQYSLGLKR